MRKVPAFRSPALLLRPACLYLFLGLGLVFPALAQPPVGGTEAREPTKRALLIGINEYKTDKVSDLAGCVNDVELMQDVLIGRMGFEPENVRILTDEKATRAGILAAIQEHLIAPSEQGDIAVLHYSGHGSRMIDTSGDELDDLDETIVPHDSRTEGVFDINDDEINGLMTRLSDKTPHAIFILDSCHSGSASRAAAGEGRVRQTPSDERTPPPPESFALGQRDLTGAADDFRLPGSDYVLISGSKASELSNETRFGELRHGAMTYYLAKALQSAAGERVTYRDIMERVQSDVTARFSSQHPQLEGTGVDNLIFGVERLFPKPYVLVDPVSGETAEAGEAVKIFAGELFGLTETSILKVYPPGTHDFADPELTPATISITTPGALSSTATVEEGSVEPRSRAVLEAVAPPDFYVGVYLEPRKDENGELVSGELSETLQTVREDLALHESVQVVEDPAAAQIRIRETAERVVLQGSVVDELAAVIAGQPETVGKVVEEVARWGRWFGLMAIDNPSPGLSVDLILRRHEPLAALPNPVIEASTSGPPGEVLPETVSDGTWVEIEVANTSNRELFPVVLDLNAQGESHVLYPVANIPDGLPPGKSVMIRVPAWIPEGRDHSADWIKVIASTESLPVALFKLPPRARGERESSEEDEGPLRAFLRSWNQGGTRNLGAGMPGLAPVPVDGWAVAQRVLRVQRSAVESSGVALHFDEAVSTDTVESRLVAGQRSICGDDPDSVCYELAGFEGDDTMVQVRTPKTRSDGGRTTSVGASFEEAYRVREETGARRAEPLLALEIERASDAPRPDDPEELDAETRGLGGKDHDDRAKNNDIWHLQYIRVPEAWANLRQSRSKTEGQEAEGVTVAHLDTGYLEHPEIWSPDGSGPIWPEKGWDYLGNDDDPVDEQSDEFLENPRHGTGSGSAIVSPAGCQLEDAEKCPTGGGRGARLVPLRVDASVVQFNTQRMTQAILDASAGPGRRVKTATDVSSIAMGGVPSWALWKAVRKAEQRGHLIIAAAGNYVKKVVWPARFKSTIAMAAVNAGCKPWAGTSIGPNVDFAAPGVSVWRANLDEEGDFATGMGTGTTYATSTTAGVAALWIARHQGTDEFDRIREDGQTTEVFRSLLKQTVWRPNGSKKPDTATCDDDAGWNRFFLGDGILDAAALLDKSLADADATRAVEAEAVEDLPLWTSLYPEATGLQVAQQDYRRLFELDPQADLETVAIYEAEVMYHYATSERVQEAVDQVALANDRSPGAYLRIREELRARDLSDSLREALR